MVTISWSSQGKLCCSSLYGKKYLSSSGDQSAVIFVLQHQLDSILSLLTLHMHLAAWWKLPPSRYCYRELHQLIIIAEARVNGKLPDSLHKLNAHNYVTAVTIVLGLIISEGEMTI